MSKHEHLSADQVWKLILSGEAHDFHQKRRFFSILPTNPRCKYCNAPFEGVGGWLVRTFYNREPSNLNPRLCNVCEQFAQERGGGAEVTLSMLFADVRGSTTLAEDMAPSAFSALMNRFYRTATDVLVPSDALIDKFVGDEVMALYVPGFAGEDYARRAIDAARDLLKATGQGSPAGPWIPVGVGIHNGEAYVGSVGSKEGVTDITALGDAVNVGARLSSAAGAGEILISQSAADAAHFAGEGLERRELTLKGRSRPITVLVERVG